MIRSLMASTALLALVTTGALAQQQPADQTQMQPPAAQQPADQQQMQPGVADQPMQRDTAAEPMAPAQAAGEILADDLIGETVYSARTEDAERIGDIRDLVLDTDGNVTSAVIGIGGFLGIGRHDVAIDFQELEFTHDQDGQLRVVVAATREQLEAMPAFEETDQTRVFGGLTEEERGMARLPEREPAQPDVAEAPEAAPDVAEAPEPGPHGAEAPEAAPEEPMVAEEPRDPAMAEPRTEVEWIDDNQVRITIAKSRTDFEQAPGFQPGMAEAPADRQLDRQQAAEPPEAEPQDWLAEQPDAMIDERLQVERIGEDEIHIVVTLDRQELGLDFEREPGVAEAPAQPAEPQLAEPAQPAAPQLAEPAQPALPMETRFLGEAEVDALRATEWLDAEVVTHDGEDLGQVSDLLLHETGDAQALLIDVGGFLGIGQREVAIQAEQFQVERVDEDQIRIVVAMSREELEQAPEFDRDMAMGERQAETAERPAEPEVAERPAEPGLVGEAPAERQAAVAPGVAPGVSGLSADELMGADVIGADNENIGNVGDVIFSRDGQIRAVIVDVGGFLGIGTREVAIAFETAQIQRDQAGDITLFVHATQEQLEQAPEYQHTAGVRQQPLDRQPAADQPAQQ